jgi:hypothetical protein
MRPRAVDYIFEIPLDLAKKITGFKHDDADEVEFDELEIHSPSKTSGKPWWRFGR